MANYETLAIETHGAVRRILLARPAQRNAQSQQMLDELMHAMDAARVDDAVNVVVIGGQGDHFSAGHDLKQAQAERSNFTVEERWAYEELRYFDYSLKIWDFPKPTIAQVQGACVAGGLMLAWVCDLIVASDDAFFQDPVVRMGIPGVEYFAHPYELNPRIAKEFLMTGDRMGAERAWQMGMVNRVVPRAELEAATYALAAKVAAQPRMGLALTKQAINHVEDLQGKRSAMDATFAWHHFAHTHNEMISGDRLGGFDGKAMAAANKRGAGEE